MSLTKKPREAGLGRVTSSFDLFCLLTSRDVGLADVLGQSLQYPDEVKDLLAILAAHSLRSREMNGSLSGCLLATALATLFQLIQHKETIEAWLLEASGDPNSQDYMQTARVVSELKAMAQGLSSEISSSVESTRTAPTSSEPSSAGNPPPSETSPGS